VSPATQDAARTATTARWLRILCALLITALLAAGVASIAVSLIPFSVLLGRVRSVSDSGQGTFFSAEFYRAMQLRLRFIGIANLAAGTILLGLRRQMYRWAGQVFTDALVLARDFCLAASSLPVIDRFTLAGLILLAALLRIPFLSQPMRYDEAVTFLEYASRPFYVALSFYSTPNNHVFHTLLVRLSYLALGNHPWSLRLPAFLAGLCLVPATYAAARSLYPADRSEGGALLAAALVASSSMLIECSTNARGYEIVCLLFMIMIPAGAYALRHQNWAAWLLLAIVSALGFYTIPIMLYPFGGVVLWLLLSIVGGKIVRGNSPADAPGNPSPGTRGALAALSVAILFTMLLAGELYSPVLAVSGPRSLFANKWVASHSFLILLEQLPESLVSTWRGWNRDLPTWLAEVLSLGFVISLVWHRRISPQRAPLPLALLLCAGPLVLLQRVIPFERVWLFALPLYFICAAAGLAFALESVFDHVDVALRVRLHPRHAMALVAVLVALFAGLRVERRGTVYLTNESRGMPALAAWLKGQLHPGDAIVTVQPSDGPLRYYLLHEGVPTWFLASSSCAPDRNLPGPHRRFVVVNEAAGDTLQQVCEAAAQPHSQTGDAKLLVQFESAKFYEMPFAPESSTPAQPAMSSRTGPKAR